TQAPRARTDTVLPGEEPSPAPARIKNIPPGTWLSRLEAPSVHLTSAVLEGTDDRTLGRGAGHIEDTPFPGESGNVGIAGHRDTVFRPLEHVKKGAAMKATRGDRGY